MLIILLAVICCIICVFSQEFIALYKKITNFYGMSLFLPLLLATVIILYYEPWVLLGLFNVKNALHQASFFLATYIPYKWSWPIANSVILLSIGILPLLVITLWNKNKFDPFQYIFLTSFIIWLIAASLIIV